MEFTPATQKAVEAYEAAHAAFYDLDGEDTDPEVIKARAERDAAAVEVAQLVVYELGRERQIVDVRWLIQIKGIDDRWFFYNRHGHATKQEAAQRAPEVAGGAETRLVRMTREVECD